MITKITSGGQTGVDEAGLVAARRHSIPTGGWAPKGWMTESGPQEELLRGYGLVECPKPGYLARTHANIRDSDFTLVVISSPADVRGGTKATIDYCLELARDPEVLRPFYTADLSDYDVALRNTLLGLRLNFGLDDGWLNVAGPRESKRPGIGQATEHFLTAVLAELGFRLASREGSE